MSLLGAIFIANNYLYMLLFQHTSTHPSLISFTSKETYFKKSTQHIKVLSTIQLFSLFIRALGSSRPSASGPQCTSGPNKGVNRLRSFRRKSCHPPSHRNRVSSNLLDVLIVSQVTFRGIFISENATKSNCNYVLACWPTGQEFEQKIRAHVDN